MLHNIKVVFESLRGICWGDFAKQQKEYGLWA